MDQFFLLNLKEEIEKLKYERLHIVWGMVNDKDVEDVLELMPRQARYYFVRADLPRSLAADKLRQAAKDFGLNGNSYPAVMDGYRAAMNAAAEGDLILVGGSTFVVAEIEDL